MAVNIDRVYQTVQRILNKEQRGYLPPAEFNLFANQSQIEIFEQYFYDQDKYMQGGRNDSDYADITQNIGEKIALFERTSLVDGAAPFDATNITNLNVFPYPNDFYRIGIVGVINDGVGGDVIKADEVSHKDAIYIKLSPLTAPTIKQPVYTRSRDGLEVMPSEAQQILLTYIKSPDEVAWGYLNVAGRSVYNANTSVNFELHPSELPELVIRICALAGVAVRAIDVAQFAQGEEASMIQQEKQ